MSLKSKFISTCLLQLRCPKSHLAGPSRAQVFPGIVSEFGGTNDSIILKGASWGYTKYTSPDPLSNRKKNLVMRQKGLRKNTLANLKHTRSMLESNKFTLSKYFNALILLRAKRTVCHTGQLSFQFILKCFGKAYLNCAINEHLSVEETYLRIRETASIKHILYGYILIKPSNYIFDCPF